jgi:hypothetical protein
MEKQEVKIRKTNFNELAELEHSGKEGIVFLGTGGEIKDWTDGIQEAWTEAGFEIVLTEALVVTTSGGRTDTLMLFEKAEADFPKLVMWRLAFGECPWLSDYVYNYIDHHADVDAKWMTKYAEEEEEDDDDEDWGDGMWDDYDDWDDEEDYL